MKKIVALLAFLFAVEAAQAVTIPISETSSYLEFNFTLRDNILTPGGVSDTYTMTLFPGSSINLFLRDRIVFIGGNEEQFGTNPSSGTFSFVQDFGDLDFSGSYLFGSTLVSWTVDSTVTTALGGDTWAGKFIGRASSVPESGSTLVLIGIGLLGLVLFQRKLA